MPDLSAARPQQLHDWLVSAAIVGRRPAHGRIAPAAGRAGADQFGNARIVGTIRVAETTDKLTNRQHGTKKPRAHAVAIELNGPPWWPIGRGRCNMIGSKQPDVTKPVANEIHSGSRGTKAQDGPPSVPLGPWMYGQTRRLSAMGISALVAGEQRPCRPSSQVRSAVRHQKTIRAEQRRKQRGVPTPRPPAPAGRYLPLWNFGDPDDHPSAPAELIDSPHLYLDRMRQGADALNGRALFYLGYCYLNGWGVSEDRVIALTCMMLAVRRRFRRARCASLTLRRTMPKNLVREAYEMARLCEAHLEAERVAA